MKEGNCSICSKESNGLWLLNLAQIDNLSTLRGSNIRESICDDCVAKFNTAVNSLADKTSMEKAMKKAGINNPVKEDRRDGYLKKSETESGLNINAQNNYLSRLVKEKVLVQIESLVGIGWRGQIKSYDNFSLIILNEHSDEDELIFKHAVKSIKPA